MPSNNSRKTSPNKRDIFKMIGKSLAPTIHGNWPRNVIKKSLKQISLIIQVTSTSRKIFSPEGSGIEWGLMHCVKRILGGSSRASRGKFKRLLLPLSSRTTSSCQIQEIQVLPNLRFTMLLGSA
jgi:hypothetical protein